MKIKKGATRIVFVLDEIVIKIPNFTYSWDHFLRGILSNINENRTWKWNSGKYKKRGNFVDDISSLLCPVKWCSWGGWVLIMEKADVERWIMDYKNKDWSYADHINEGLGGDDNVSNYGYINDILVKVDYGEIDKIFT